MKPDPVRALAWCLWRPIWLLQLLRGPEVTEGREEPSNKHTQTSV